MGYRERAGACRVPCFRMKKWEWIRALSSANTCTIELITSTPVFHALWVYQMQLYLVHEIMHVPVSDDGGFQREGVWRGVDAAVCACRESHMRVVA